MDYSPLDIVEHCTRVLLKVQQEARELAWADPARCFERLYLSKQQKPAAVVDVLAEWRAKEGLGRYLRKLNPLILGEESLSEALPKINSHKGVTVLLDAIDGTRLFECGLGNWCSAVTVFDPMQEIICAVVLLESGVAYFATAEGAGRLRTHRNTFDHQTLCVTGAPSTTQTSIACHGYSARRGARLGAALARVQASFVNSADMFTFGGNPALVHLIDDSTGLDAVIEPIGQMPHDFLAGAYICRQAGGCVVDLEGRSLSLYRLLPSGLKRKITYVAGRNQTCVERLRSAYFSSQPSPPSQSEFEETVDFCGGEHVELHH